MVPPRLPSVTREQLAYLRAHIREAITEDRIACLECGAQFRKLGRHVTEKHGISLEAYRARWGYNRLTGLVCGELLECFRSKAKVRGLGTRNTREMALEALRVRGTKGRILLRREALERLRERPLRGQRVGPPQKITDDELIALSNQGLSFVQIARLQGLARVNVWRRLAKLRARGVPIPSGRRRRVGGQHGKE